MKKKISYEDPPELVLHGEVIETSTMSPDRTELALLAEHRALTTVRLEEIKSWLGAQARKLNPHQRVLAIEVFAGLGKSARWQSAWVKS